MDFIIKYDKTDWLSKVTLCYLIPNAWWVPLLNQLFHGTLVTSIHFPCSHQDFIQPKFYRLAHPGLPHTYRCLPRLLADSFILFSSLFMLIRTNTRICYLSPIWTLAEKTPSEVDISPHNSQNHLFWNTKWHRTMLINTKQITGHTCISTLLFTECLVWLGGWLIPGSRRCKPKTPVHPSHPPLR